jgi:hypothetical protein
MERLHLLREQLGRDDQAELRVLGLQRGRDQVVQEDRDVPCG